MKNLIKYPQSSDKDGKIKKFRFAYPIKVRIGALISGIVL